MNVCARPYGIHTLPIKWGIYTILVNGPFYSWWNVNCLFKKTWTVNRFWWLVNSYFNSWWLVKEAFLRWWMMIQDILVTYDSGWWINSQCMVIGELTNLILVNGELVGVYTPPPPIKEQTNHFSTPVILINGDADSLYIAPVMALIAFLWATSNLLRCFL